MKQIKTANYVRINKKTARALYKTGRQNRLYFCPVNMRPEHPFSHLWRPPNNDLPFDQIVTEYEHYTCDNERGRYTAFYVPRKWYNLTQAVAHAWDPEDPAYKALEDWEATHP